MVYRIYDNGKPTLWIFRDKYKAIQFCMSIYKNWEIRRERMGIC